LEVCTGDGPGFAQELESLLHFLDAKLRHEWDFSELDNAIRVVLYTAHEEIVRYLRSELDAFPASLEADEDSSDEEDASLEEEEN
jgi:hypothetical protein